MMTETFYANEKMLEALTRGLIQAATRPLVIALQGDLGAGKTTLVRYLAKALGITERVTSPSFVLMNRYAPASSGQAGLLHADFYRLDPNGGSDLIAEIEEALERFSLWVFVEWSERLPEFHALVDLDIVIRPDREGRRYDFTSHSPTGRAYLKHLMDTSIIGERPV
jgi:tRNA threonylcarbamoyladenosine biosynthesis protein TsaE